MKRKTILWAMTGLLTVLINAKSIAQTGKDDLSPIKKEIAKTNALYFDLFKKYDDAIVKLYTDDACLLAPNAPAICGKTALLKDFKDTYATRKIGGVKFVTGNIYGDGNAYL